MTPSYEVRPQMAPILDTPLLTRVEYEDGKRGRQRLVSKLLGTV